MSKRFILLVCLLLVLSTEGCVGLKEKARPTPEGREVTMKSQKIAFEPYDINKVQAKITAYAEKNKSAETSSLLEDHGRFFLLLTRGVKPTGGYSVKVTEVFLDTADDNSTKLRAYYQYKDPGPDQFVTQVLTTPMELVLLKGIKRRPDRVVFIKT